MITEYANKILSHFLDKSSLPEKILFDEPYWRIYVTLYGKSEYRGEVLACQSSSNQDIEKAIIEAITKCINDHRFVICKNYFLIVTVVKGPEVLNTEKFVLGYHAVSTDGAFYKETVPITNCWDANNLLYKLYQKAKAKEELPLWQHESKSYLHGVGELSFAHKPVKDISDLDKRLDLAGEFLSRMAHPDGMFFYSFNPVKQKYSEENNFIRQLATLWIFCKWVNSRGRREYAGFCHTSLNLAYDAYCNNFFQPETNIAHLGFFLLATLETQRNKEIDRLQDELVNKILIQQKEDGSFKTVIGKEDILKGINYYPCEALLALKEYSVKRKTKIDAIEKAYPFYLFHFQNAPNLSIITWFTQVYGSDKSKELLDYLVSHQNKDGSFTKEGMASTCTFAEGLAYGGRVEELKKALKFCCQLQYSKEDLYYLKDDFALGGIRKSLTDCELRIDYTQHFMNAIMLSKGVL